jgi:2-polyprenyl-6-methoxyphenol hydroxylase-like FAD-dependent oxidoreductase
MTSESPSISTGEAEAGPIRSVLIVGGGTAGWMAAVYLRKALHNHVRITLVESKRIGTVGVGEATFNTIKSFFDQVGLDERDWMPACNATYKMAIRFVGWRGPSAQPFYHPFERYRLMALGDTPIP